MRKNHLINIAVFAVLFIFLLLFLLSFNWGITGFVINPISSFGTFPGQNLSDAYQFTVPSDYQGCYAQISGLLLCTQPCSSALLTTVKSCSSQEQCNVSVTASEAFDVTFSSQQPNSTDSWQYSVKKYGYCGDSICGTPSGSEYAQGTCLNGNIIFSENCSSCPSDCNACTPPSPVCGNSVCETNETCLSCSTDCSCSSGDCCSPSSQLAGSRGCINQSTVSNNTICCNSNFTLGNCCSDANCNSTQFCSNSTCTIKKADGQSCSLSSECLGAYCVHSLCRSNTTFCGDSYCDSGENCSLCSSDCNECQQQTITPEQECTADSDCAIFECANCESEKFICNSGSCVECISDDNCKTQFNCVDNACQTVSIQTTTPETNPEVAPPSNPGGITGQAVDTPPVSEVKEVPLELQNLESVSLIPQTNDPNAEYTELRTKIQDEIYPILLNVFNKKQRSSDRNITLQFFDLSKWDEESNIMYIPKEANVTNFNNMSQKSIQLYEIAKLSSLYILSQTVELEGSTLLVSDTNYKNTPLWLREGLAEFGANKYFELKEIDKPLGTEKENSFISSLQAKDKNFKETVRKNALKKATFSSRSKWDSSESPSIYEGAAFSLTKYMIEKYSKENVTKVYDLSANNNKFEQNIIKTINISFDNIKEQWFNSLDEKYSLIKGLDSKPLAILDKILAFFAKLLGISL